MLPLYLVSLLRVGQDSVRKRLEDELESKKHARGLGRKLSQESTCFISVKTELNLWNSSEKFKL